MGVGAYIIGIIKTNRKLLCKDNIENLTKDFTGGSYLVLRSNPMVSGGRPLIDIGYNYNTWKFSSFIVKVDTVRTNADIPFFI